MDPYYVNFLHIVGIALENIEVPTVQQTLCHCQRREVCQTCVLPAPCILMLVIKLLL